MVMSEGKMFFQSLTNACHAQPLAGEFPAHSQTRLAFLLPQAWPWLWAGKLSRQRRNITGVCSTTSFAWEMLLEGTGEQAVLDLSLADHLLVGQGINNSIQLSGHLPLQTTVPPGAECWAPVARSWLTSLWTLCGRSG